MSHTEVFALPDAGEGLTEAEIVAWRVQVGDQVSVNQPFVEIETAKSSLELPCPFAGRVAELHATEGQRLAVGEPLISIEVAGAESGESGGGDGAARDRDSERATRDRGGDGAASNHGAHGAASNHGAHGAASNHGAHGAASRPGADGAAARLAGATARTDAADTALVTTAADPALVTTATDPQAGQNGSPAVQDASSANPAVLVGYGLRPEVAPSGSIASTPTSPMPQPNTQSADSAPVATPALTAEPGAPRPDARRADSFATSATSTPRPPVLAKPPVRKLAKDLGLDLITISPTGPGGIVTREDVLAAREDQSARRLATYPGEDAPWLNGGTVSRDGRSTRVPIRSVRRRTAEAMVSSAFTAPHVTVFHTLDVTKTMKLVARLKDDREFRDIHVTPLLIAAKALLLAVRRHPEINASWDEDAQEIVYRHYVNLGIAAATPRGLVVPNIKDAHRLSLLELGRTLGELAQTARTGATKPGDMADGTITITNVGVFGIDSGTPILNPGEAAILAFGKVARQPWVHGGKIKARWVTQLALSFDHRLVDGELGSRVLADVAAVLADPSQGLVWS